MYVCMFTHCMLIYVSLISVSCSNLIHIYIRTHPHPHMHTIVLWRRHHTSVVSVGLIALAIRLMALCDSDKHAHIHTYVSTYSNTIIQKIMPAQLISKCVVYCAKQLKKPLATLAREATLGRVCTEYRRARLLKTLRNRREQRYAWLVSCVYLLSGDPIAHTTL